MRCLCLVIATTLLLPGCQHEPAAALAPGGHHERKNPTVEPTRILKVKVTAGGDVTADDQPATLEQLADRLRDLKRTEGVVWYHRENPAGEPHANAERVIKLVTENQLPIRLSAKPDFSDSVDPAGFSRSEQE